MSKIDEKLRQMGYDIKPTPPPTTDFVQGYRAGNTVYLSGAGPRGTDGSIVLGKVGKDLTVEQGIRRGPVVRPQPPGQLEEHHRRPGQSQAHRPALPAW